MKIQEIKNYKFLLFLLLFLITISPVLFYRYFPTVDGPAHLYNARIIRELFFGNSNFYSSFFILNPVPVPNWTGHALAMLFGSFLPVWLTEKMIILLIVCLFPLSIIYFSKAYGATISWHMLLVLPLIYNITLYLGFFNFLLGLVLMFFFLARFKKHKVKDHWRGFIFMTLSATLIYFSHLMVFILAIILAAMELLRSSYKGRIFNFKCLIKLAVFIPGLIFVLFYFRGRGAEGFKNSIDFIPTRQLLTWIYEGLPLVGLNGEEEGLSTMIFVAAITVLGIFIVINRYFKKTGLKPNDVFLIFAAIMLLFYFTVPDGFASGGFLSLRFLLLFIIFIVAWIFTHSLPVPVSVIAGLVGLYVSYSTLAYRHRVTAQLSADAANMISISEKVKKGTVLLPLNYSGNWLHTNLSNYMGAAQPVIVLDNYEAVLNEFPLKWKTSKQPFQLAGNFTQSLNPSISIEKYESTTGTVINYVTRWQFTHEEQDSLKTATDNSLKMWFQFSERVEQCDLFYN